MRFLKSIFILCLSGCAAGPDYKRPDFTLPDHFKATNERLETNKRWWENFEDPTLNKLMLIAAKDNLDLQMAESRIRQSSFAKRGLEAELFPTLNSNGNAYREARSLNKPNIQSTGRYLSDYRIGFDASWEIDFFGKVRRGLELSKADIEANIFNKADLFVSLSAEIAQNYIHMRKIQNELRLNNALDNTWKSIIAFRQQQILAGIGNEADLNDSKASHGSIIAKMPSLKAEIQATQYMLSLLLGKNPQDFYADLNTETPLPSFKKEVLIGIPSILLEQRPDIRKAEAELKKATAQIGIEITNLFPRFSLTALLGQESSMPGQLWKAQSSYFTLGPSFSLTLFDFGTICSAIDKAKEFQNEQMLAYKKTILTALKEVEEYSIRFLKEAEGKNLLSIATQKAEESQAFYQKRFDTGIVNRLQALQSKVTHLNQKMMLLNAQEQELTYLISLYKALGGGWISIG